MFLISEAFRSLNERHWRGWDWRSTNILYISWDWDNGPEALAGRRLVKSLLEAGARVHVLSAIGPRRASAVSQLRRDRRSARTGL